MVSLTIHFDMEVNGGIDQVALGIKGVLSLLLSIHPLQLQTGVVSKEEKKSRSEMTNSAVSIQTVPIYHTATSSFQQECMTQVFPGEWNDPRFIFKFKAASPGCHVVAFWSKMLHRRSYESVGQLQLSPVVVSHKRVLLHGCAGRRWGVPSVFCDLRVRFDDHTEFQIFSLIHLHR